MQAGRFPVIGTTPTTPLKGSVAAAGVKMDKAAMAAVAAVVNTAGRPIRPSPRQTMSRWVPQAQVRPGAALMRAQVGLRLSRRARQPRSCRPTAAVWHRPVQPWVAQEVQEQPQTPMVARAELNPVQVRAVAALVAQMESAEQVGPQQMLLVQIPAAGAADRAVVQQVLCNQLTTLALMAEIILLVRVMVSEVSMPTVPLALVGEVEGQQVGQVPLAGLVQLKMAPLILFLGHLRQMVLEEVVLVVVLLRQLALVQVDYMAALAVVQREVVQLVQPENKASWS